MAHPWIPSGCSSENPLGHPTETPGCRAYIQVTETDTSAIDTVLAKVLLILSCIVLGVAFLTVPSCREPEGVPQNIIQQQIFLALESSPTQRPNVVA